MRRLFRTGSLIALAATIVVIGGCLVSGTFTVVEEFHFTAATGFYPYHIDVTGEPDWDDHSDDINAIDLVGFELYLTNNESSEVTFRAYVDDGENPLCLTPACLDTNSTKIVIIDDLTIPAGPGGKRHVTYGESFTYLVNMDSLKTLMKTGKLNYYGTSTTGTDAGFVIDTGKVIVTFSASGS